MINGFLSTGWAKKGPVGRSGFFNFIFFNFSLTRMHRKLREKNFFSKITKKKFQSALFSGQETTFYLSVA